MLRRLRFLRRSHQLREEMEAHIAIAADEFEAQGLPRREAELAARKRFGSTAFHAEESRNVWIARWAADLAHDLRYAARSIRRDPGFAIVATLSAALAIGACTTIFSVANFALFQSLPVQDPVNLLSISTGLREGEGGTPLSHPQLTDLREQAESLRSVAASAPFVPAAISIGGGEPKHYWGSLATANFFEVVQPKFVLGNGFRPESDDTPGAPAVIVLSHALWRSHFGADPAILGRTIEFNKQKATVVGVTAAGFRGTALTLADDFWIPFSMRSEHARGAQSGRFTGRNIQWLQTVARLTPGATLEQARSEAAVIGSRIRSSENPNFYYVETAGKISPGLRSVASLFFGLALAVTLIILLIACANVANLLLARGEGRQKEIMTRLALGAARGRLIRQFLAESIVLALLGGIPGILLAYWGTQALGRFRLPLPMPIDLTVALDGRVALFCFGLCLVTGVLFGLIPALRSSDTRLLPRRAGWLSRGLVVLQVAASLLLLIGSGLFLRSLQASQTVDLGLNERNVLMLNFDPRQGGYDPNGQLAFLRTLLSETGALNGVLSVAVTHTVPLTFSGSNSQVEPVGRDAQPVRVNVYGVTPEYFTTLGIPFRQGGTYRGEDDDVIINQHLADRILSGGNAEGQFLRYEGRLLRVIGVVANSKSRMVSEDQTACIYLPLLRVSTNVNPRFGLTLLVRALDRPLALADAVRGVFKRLDRTIVPRSVVTFEEHIQNSLFLPRLGALLFGLCGGMGLLIASIGVYGVISFNVSKRTKEIGIRMALGAERGQVMGMIMWQGLRLALVGSAIGIAGGFGFGKIARSLLYGVSANDPPTFVAVPLFLLAVAAVATLLPARRAVRTDPMAALRYE